MVGVRRRFTLADTTQQVVGGFLLVGPFIVAEEIWVLARSTSFAQALPTLTIVLTVDYDALYKTDDRDPDRKREVGGVPVRFISLISVSYLFVFILVLAFDAPGAFPSDMSGEVLVSMLGYEPNLAMLRIMLKATNIGAVLSVIDAATADSLF